MLEGFVSVTNFLEEVDLILPGEESSPNAVYGGVSPSLIVEATLLIEIVEIFAISFATPEVQISNFKVTPD